MFAYVYAYLYSEIYRTILVYGMCSKSLKHEAKQQGIKKEGEFSPKNFLSRPAFKKMSLDTKRAIVVQQESERERERVLNNIHIQFALLLVLSSWAFQMCFNPPSLMTTEESWPLIPQGP